MAATDEKSTGAERGGKKRRERPASAPERKDPSEARRRYYLAVLDSKSGEPLRQLNERLRRLEKREPKPKSYEQLLGLETREPEESTLADRALEMARTKREAIQRVLSNMLAEEREVSRADEIGIARLVASVLHEMPTEQRERLVRELKRIPAKSREDSLRWLHQRRAEKLHTLTAWLDDLAELETDLNVLRELVPRLRKGLTACFAAEYKSERYNERVNFMEAELAMRMHDAGMSPDEIRPDLTAVDAHPNETKPELVDKANKALLRRISRHRNKHYLPVE